MNKKWKKVLWGMAVCLLVLSFGLFMPGKEAEAASRKKLNVGKTYTVKLNGEKHKLRFTTVKQEGENEYLKKINVFVDGKRVKTYSSNYIYRWEISLCQVGAGRSLIFMEGISDNDYPQYMRVAEYRNGKWKGLADLAKSSRNGTEYTGKFFSSWARGSLKKVGKNKLVVRWADTGKSTGIFEVEVAYQLKGKKLVRKTGPYTLKFSEYISKTWTASKEIQTYTKAGGAKESFSVEVGEKVTPKKVTSINGTFWFQIQDASGKLGWFMDADTYGNTYFEEAMFAG